jgi:manganese/zinc/iron transport system permease protein
MQSLSFYNIVETLLNPSILIVLTGCILIAIQSAAIGTITVLKKQSLSGDAIAHAVLPGLCMAFLLSGEKSSMLFLIGAALTGWLGLFTIQWLYSNTKLKKDAATGIILSVFFGIGILLLTFIQQTGNGQQSGLDTFLLGKASAMLPEDLLPLMISTTFILGGILLLKKEFILIIFDKEFAAFNGLPVSILEFLLQLMLIIAIVTGITATGAILIGSILIIPYAIASFWKRDIDGILLIAFFSSIASSFLGILITVFFPHIPTGATIVLVLSILFCISALFSPKRGILSRVNLQRKHHKQTIEDNILKYSYHHVEQNQSPLHPLPQKAMIPIEYMNSQVPEFQKYITQLQSHGFAEKCLDESVICITKEGLLRGMKITRLHRLWEAYLIHAAKFDIDHIHDDAESIEHILTPELEQQLQSLLGNPMTDPHGEHIPPSYLH